MLDPLQIGVAAALGLVPDGKRTPGRLIDDVGSLSARDIAQLVHLFVDGLTQLVHLAFGLLAQGVGTFPGFLKNALHALAESVQRWRLSGAGLALVGSHTAMQLAELAHGRCETALRLRGAVERLIEYFGGLQKLLAAPVDVEDRGSYRPFLDCLVLFHIASTLSASRMLPSHAFKNGDPPGVTPHAEASAALSRRGSRHGAN